MSLAPSVPAPRAKFNPLPIYIGLFCLVWSFGFVTGKIFVADCPPLVFLTARFSLAGVLILGSWALRNEEWSLSWRDTVVFVILGVANNALYFGFGWTGLKTVSAGLGSLIVSANPVFTGILAAAFLGEQLTWRKVAGLLLGLAGVGFIVWHRVSIAPIVCMAFRLHSRLWRRLWLAPFCSRCWRQAAACGSATVSRTWPVVSRCCRLRSCSQIVVT